jgi:hypothetical protein
MARQHPNRESIAGVVLLSAVMAYFVCSYWLAVKVVYTAPPVNGEIRYYRYGWQAIIFRPVADIEGAITGRITTTDSCLP